MTSPPLKGLELRREQSDFTQADLGEAIDVTQSHYLKLERGKVRLDVHRAAVLAKKLGCRIDDLL
jgi:transcriptional regulator with XRE-family HTH domain